MTLLTLEEVCKRSRAGAGERVVLSRVSLQLDARELAVVWGARRSGRSTLLRIAAGIEAPDSGVVRFDGRDLADHGENIIGGGIGYCQTSLRCAEAPTVLEQVMIALLARGVPPSAARSQARGALERVGAARSGGLRVDGLDGAESIRMALARALALQPTLLVVDEPTKGVDLLERDAILLLLRSLADDGIAVLASTGESTGLSGADGAFALGEGKLRAAQTRELAPVLPLRRPAAGAAIG